MKRCVAIALGLSLIFAGASWGFQLFTSPLALGNPQDQRPVGWIIEASGSVPIKPSGTQAYYRVSVNTPLLPRTLIFPPEGMTVKILCADRQTYWIVPSGVPSGVSNGCPPLSENTENGTSPTRGSGICSVYQSENIPYIITPRSTFLLNNKPIFRWNSVDGVTSYKVRVNGESGDIWQTTLSESQVVYPNNPPLQPGKMYSLIVAANNNSFSTEEDPLILDIETPGMSFGLLPEAKTKEVRKDIEQLQKQELRESGKTLAIARIYNDYRLRTEAIALLESGVKNGIESGAGIYQMLGDLYCQVGLTRLAEQNYLQAIDQAKVNEDLAGKSAAHAELGNLYNRNGNDDGARFHWQQAINGYRKLQDMQRVIQIEEKLKYIQE